MHNQALIIGAGAGLSASLTRLFTAKGLGVDLAARTPVNLETLVAETGATSHQCDAADPADIAALFDELDAAGRTPDVVVYNPSARVHGPIAEIDPTAVEAAVQITALGAFHTAQQAARRMIPKRQGAILLTGATAGVKGFTHSAAFAMGKFALRGLAQSLTRELHPKGIHIGHFIIDGGIRNPARPERIDAADNPDSMLSPDAIANEFWRHLEQDRSCWSWEVEIRPWVERF
ncbi:MAG: SDR family NAD(P)-dependent oxidoreductase [Pikeienuella sp.]